MPGPRAVLFMEHVILMWSLFVAATYFPVLTQLAGGFSLVRVADVPYGLCDYLTEKTRNK